MAAPAAYTEETLALFMHTVLSAVADVLGWSVAADSYTEAVNSTLLVYGVDSVSEVTGRANIAKLRALAKVEAWRAVASATAADYDFDADGGKYNRSQLHAMALENLTRSQQEATPYDPNWRVVIDSVTYKNDPYRYLPEDEATQ